MAINLLKVDMESYNKAAIQKVHNALRELTLEGSERDPNLSKTVVKNIELLPPYIPGQNDKLAPSINISFNNTIGANQLAGKLQDSSKIVSIRIDTYLGNTTSFKSGGLVEVQSDLKDDFEYVLDPKNFIGSPFGSRDITDIAQLVENAIQNGELTGASIPQVTQLVNLVKNQAPLPRGAQIQDAGIILWTPDPETQATGREVLTTVFQLQLNYSTNVSQR